MSEQAELVQRAIAGEPLALDKLLLDSYGRLAARVDQKLPADLRSLVAPEDVIQEVFTDAFRHIAAFEPRGQDAFYRWLTAIADNRITDTVRAHRAAKRGGDRARAEAAGRTSILSLLEVMAVTDRTPSRSAGGHEAAAALQVALAGLKEEYREALALRYLEGLPVAEAARRLGKTEPAVHKLCSRGLQALRTSMGEATKFLSRG